MPVLATPVNLDPSWVLWVDLLLIYRFHELTYDQRNTLYPLDLFLCPDKLSFQ